jgi:hypothetical protein
LLSAHETCQKFSYVITEFGSYLSKFSNKNISVV